MKTCTRFFLAAVVAGMVAICSVAVAHAQAAPEIRDLIQSLEVGEAVYYENLTIIPIYTNRVKDRTAYTTLDEALSRRWLDIQELEGGSVPEVRLNNNSDHSIYIMAGEILTGCKQDRLVGKDILLRPRSKNVIVPVYCVEEGRWTSQSREFYSKENLGTPHLRKFAQKAGTSAQGAIWDSIRSVNRSMRNDTRTGAYQSLYENQDVQRQIRSYEQSMRSVPQLYRDTVGVVIGIGDRVVSTDIFANPELFRKLWPKLLKSSALSAVSSDLRGTLTQDEAARFLRDLYHAQYDQRAGVDLGYEFTSQDGYTNAFGLVYRGAVVHLSVFPEERTNEIFRYRSHVDGVQRQDHRVRVMR